MADPQELPQCDWHAAVVIDAAVPSTPVRCTEPAPMQWRHQDEDGTRANFCPSHAVRMAEITLGIMHRFAHSRGIAA